MNTIVNTANKNVLIIHGWMNSSAMYSSVKDDLKDIANAVLVDLPGFGDCKPLYKSNIINNYVCYVYDILKSNSFDLVVLLYELVNNNRLNEVIDNKCTIIISSSGRLIDNKKIKDLEANLVNYNLITLYGIGNTIILENYTAFMDVIKSKLY